MSDSLRKLKLLVEACSLTPDKVFVLKTARETLGYFNFKNEPEKSLKSFITSNGLEQPTESRTPGRWKNDPDPNSRRLVYAIDFFSGPKFGYLAFIHESGTQFFSIKSFKKNLKPDPRERKENETPSQLAQELIRVLGQRKGEK